MTEIWKDIKGYEGIYQVSSRGKVRSFHFGKNIKILRFSIRGGYANVILYKNKKRKTFSVHRLVAEAFIDNPNDLPEVNHKDEDKLNNQVENLEWCTPKYNSNYGTRNKRIKETKSRNKKEELENGNL